MADWAPRLERFVPPMADPAELAARTAVAREVLGLDPVPAAARKGSA
jgi:hypothetical protein